MRGSARYKCALKLNRKLDELAAAAVPPLNSWPVGGWVVRSTPGLAMKRANSVYPRRHRGVGIGEDLRLCERHYRDLGLPTRFQLGPASEPPGLEAFLLESGYRAHTPVGVRTCPLPEPGGAGRSTAPAIEVTSSPTSGWWSAALAAGAVAASQRHLTAALLGRVARSMVFVRMRADGMDAGVARGVLDGRWVGIFDLATVPALRGQGVGRAVLDALMRRARKEGAAHAYLQVEEDNAAASRLYDRAGFDEPAYPYRYLTKDQGSRPKRSMPRGGRLQL